MKTADPSIASKATAQQAEDAAFYREVLHTLITLGTEIAAAVPRQATAPDVDAEASVAFDRIACTVRRTILLAQRVAEPRAAVAGGAHRTLARKQIIRAVEDEISRDRDDEDAEHLHAEFVERLDTAELDEELDHRPVAEIIIEICHDLGLMDVAGHANLSKRRSPAEVAALRALAARPGPVALPNVTRFLNSLTTSDPSSAAPFGGG